VRRRLAAGIAAVVAVVVLAHGVRLAPLALRGLRVPEQRFLAQWEAGYGDLVAASAGGGGADHAVGAVEARAERADDDRASHANRALGAALAEAASRRAALPTNYDPAYVQIPFPGGDIAPDRGVCTDLVVRAHRDVGIDLQEAVHSDMSTAFERYPDIWGATAPDSNIDHRRVPNLMVFFGRHGLVLPIPDDPRAYTPGDVVTWHLGRGLTHIGIVTHHRDPGTGRPLVAHHVGGHPSVDDVLEAWEVVGRFRYAGEAYRVGLHPLAPWAQGVALRPKRALRATEGAPACRSAAVVGTRIEETPA